MSERIECKREYYRAIDRNIELRREYYQLLDRVSRFKAVRILADQFQLSVKHVRKVLDDMTCGSYPS